jgi:hypothetical protein
MDWGFVDKTLVPDRDLRLLEKFTKAAGRDDVLEIKTYGRFERLMDHVWVDTSLNRVEVLFPSTSPCGNYRYKGVDFLT